MVKIKGYLATVLSTLGLISVLGCSDSRPITPTIDASPDKSIVIDTSIKDKTRKDTTTIDSLLLDASPDAVPWVYPDPFELSKLRPINNGPNHLIGKNVTISGVIPKMVGSDGKKEDVTWKFQLKYDNKTYNLISGFMSKNKITDSERYETFELNTAQPIPGTGIFFKGAKINTVYTVLNPKNIAAFTRASTSWSLNYPDHPLIKHHVYQDTHVGKPLKITMIGQDPLSKKVPIWILEHSDIKTAVIDSKTGVITTPKALDKDQSNQDLEITLQRADDTSKETDIDFDFDIDNVANELQVYKGSVLVAKIRMSSDTANYFWTSCNGPCGNPGYQHDVNQGVISVDCKDPKTAKQVNYVLAAINMAIGPWSKKNYAADLQHRTTIKEYASITQKIFVVSTSYSACTLNPDLRIVNKTFK